MRGCVRACKRVCAGVRLRVRACVCDSDLTLIANEKRNKVKIFYQIVICRIGFRKIMLTTV